MHVYVCMHLCKEEYSSLMLSMWCGQSQQHDDDSTCDLRKEEYLQQMMQSSSMYIYKIILDAQ